MTLLHQILLPAPTAEHIEVADRIGLDIEIKVDGDGGYIHYVPPIRRDGRWAQACWCRPSGRWRLWRDGLWHDGGESDTSLSSMLASLEWRIAEGEARLASAA